MFTHDTGALAQHTSSSVSELQEHLIQVLHPVARKYDLTLNAFGRVVHTGQVGEVFISDEYDSALDPSPVTPIGHGPYSILAGTIKATMESSNFYNVTQVVVSPSLSLGLHLACSSSHPRLIHTSRQYWWDLIGYFVRLHAGLTCIFLDTRFYWNLTKHIFRFSPFTSADYYNGFHTVNEGEWSSFRAGTYLPIPCSITSRGDDRSHQVPHQSDSQSRRIFITLIGNMYPPKI